MRSKNLKSSTPRPAEVPLADPDVLLVADAMVLSTEDKTKFITLYHEFLAEHRPQGPTQRALVEDMVCARWRQRRCASMQTAMLNITMERRTGYVEREFDKPRTAPIAALAYLDQVELDNTLGKLTR